MIMLEYYGDKFLDILGDPENQFLLSPVNSTSNTTLSRVKQLDRESVGTIILTIEARNLYNPAKYTFQNITITVTDINDNPPLFLRNYVLVTIPENITVGSDITAVNATDLDSGVNAEIQYSIVPGSAKTVFSINPISGVITLNNSLDREIHDRYFLFVEANDKVFSSYAEVCIIVSDINEHKPYFITKLYNVSIEETHSPGNVIVRVLAKDKDAGDNANIFYNMTIGNYKHMFSINDRGEIFNTRSLDYETNKTFDLHITIHDGGTPSLYGNDVGRVNIHIIDSNDHSPKFINSEFIGYIVENMGYFYPPFHINAVDKDAGMFYIFYICSSQVIEVFHLLFCCIVHYMQGLHTLLVKGFNTHAHIQTCTHTCMHECTHATCTQAARHVHRHPMHTHNVHTPHTGIHACTHAHIHPCTATYLPMHTCMHTHMHTCMYTHTHICMHTLAHVHSHHICTLTPHMHTHAHMHTCTHMHTYVHRQTQTQTDTTLLALNMISQLLFRVQVYKSV